MADYLGNLLRSGATLFGRLGGHRTEMSRFQTKPTIGSASLPEVRQDLEDESLTPSEFPDSSASRLNPETGAHRGSQMSPKPMLHSEGSPESPNRVSPAIGDEASSSDSPDSLERSDSTP